MDYKSALLPDISGNVNSYIGVKWNIRLDYFRFLNSGIYFVINIVVVVWDHVFVELQPQMGSLSVLKMTNEWIWGSGEMMLMAGNRGTLTQTCPNSTLPTTNPTWLPSSWTRDSAMGSQRLTTLCYGRDKLHTLESVHKN